MDKNATSDRIRACVTIIGIQAESADRFKLASLDVVQRKCTVYRGLTKGGVLSLWNSLGAEVEYTWSTCKDFKHCHKLPAQVRFPELFIIDALQRHKTLGITYSEIETVNAVYTSNRPRPLYPSTLSELGITKTTGHVPSLVENCFKKGVPAHCRHKLRQWLCYPPSIKNANRIRYLIHWLLTSEVALPKLFYINAVKFLPLIQKRKVSIGICKELRILIECVKHLATLDLFEALFQLAASENTIENLQSSYFKKKIETISITFSEILSNEVIDVSWIDIQCGRNAECFKKWHFAKCQKLHGLNINHFKSDILLTQKTLKNHLNAFPSAEEINDNNLNLELSNNRIYISAKKKYANINSSWRKATWTSRKKKLSGLYTTEAIEKTYVEYEETILKLNRKISEFLITIATRMDKFQRFFVLCSSTINIFETLLRHVRARGLQWCSAKIVPNSTMQINDLAAYWISDSTLNNVDLNGQMIITGANASGKSTFIRSAISTALLGTCGLLCPAKFVSLPVFKSFYLRISAKDDPRHQKSSFEIEIEDIAMLTHEVDRFSLLGIDEPFRSTQPRIALDFTIKTIEYLRSKHTITFFATHLVHELAHIFKDPSRFWHISSDRKLTKGPCFESNAYQVALSSGVSRNFLQLSDELPTPVVGKESISLHTVLEEVDRIVKRECPFSICI